MGIIKAAISAVGGALADQWQEVIEAGEMGDDVVFCAGVAVRRGQNRKGTPNTVSNGSVIHVGPNQFMMLVDGGRIVDYSAQEGYFTVDSSSLPSLFNGELDEALQESFQRIRFGGQTPSSQRVYFVNLQEIKGIRFGTRNPINYFDNFYNSELFLRCHGTYSIRIVDPIQFYAEAIPHDRDVVRIGDINEQYLDEFLQALQAAINQMSADGVRISYVPSKGGELSDHMSRILDERWRESRGIQVESVGVASISYDEESQKLINMRNQGAIMSDASVQQGYMRSAVARGIEAAGSNPNGAMAGFMGVNMGMQAGAGVLNAAPAPAQAPQPGSWTCSCGAVNTGNFCGSCGAARPDRDGWTCSCGTRNTGRFCSNCGKERPAAGVCPHCGEKLPDGAARFCPSCGKALQQEN